MSGLRKPVGKIAIFRTHNPNNKKPLSLKLYSLRSVSTQHCATPGNLYLCPCAYGSQRFLPGPGDTAVDLRRAVSGLTLCSTNNDTQIKPLLSETLGSHRVY
jgi:hypothetical protein